MDHRIPKVGVAICIVLAIGALITFMFLNNRFEGPNPVAFLSHPYELTARFKDNKTLPTKQAVLYRGIQVGKVSRVKWDRSSHDSVVTLTMNKGFTLYRDAVIRIGYRSLLGDPYLAVDSRGSPSAPALKSGDVVPHTTTTVDFDEALSFLDSEGREHVKSLIKTVADGTAAPGNGERLNGTLGGASRTISELGTLTSTLHGQEKQIATLVRTASTVLSTIGDREKSIRTIIGAGRTTLDALASNTSSLEQGVEALPRLLRYGRSSLAELRPLLSDARPIFAKLRGVAPDLAAALDPKARYPLTESLANLITIAKGLGPLNKQAVPVLGKLRKLLVQLKPLVEAASPGARNLVPALDYLTPRSKAIATGYALLAASLNHTDANGHYILLGANLDPTETADTPISTDCTGAPALLGYCNNAYPGPDDALNPQPYRPPYPKIVPCTVPPRSTPKAPCK
jgi:phospholipid/cholesterol/gamma-HCH transport system substrate-binding protein